MNVLRNWLLPLLLAAAQVVSWTVSGRVDELPVMALLGAVAVAAALGWRRRAPVVALVVVVGALALTRATTPMDTLDVLELAEMVALFSVAVRRSTRVAVALVVVVVCLQWLYWATTDDVDGEYAADAGGTTIAYVLALGLGTARRRWVANRRIVDEQIRRATHDRDSAAADERQVLAHELHDVSAHHLTSIVVTVGAATRLRDSRPELLAAGLDHAVDAGRTALAEIERLLAAADRVGLTSPAGGTVLDPLYELVDAFRRLGQPVELDADTGAVPDRVATAVHGIAREALTNALRYAPGSPVRVTVRSQADTLTLTVENQRSAAPTRGWLLGSGRGIAGMRRRVTALAGDLTVGALPDGGWRVAATLPLGRVGTRARRTLPRPEPADVATFLAVLALAVGMALLPDSETPALRLSLVGWLLTGALLVAHTVPLMWRRRAPWRVLAAVLVTVALWPVWFGSVPDRLGLGAVCACVAELTAVFAVAVYARRRWLGALSVPVTGAAGGAVVAARVLVDAVGKPETLWFDVINALFAGALFAVGIMVLVGPFWLAGLGVRIRRDRVFGREHAALTAALDAVAAETAAERGRIAVRLRRRVLAETGQVIDAAERRDADEVLAAARAALASMRELLRTLDDAEVHPLPAALELSA